MERLNQPQGRVGLGQAYCEAYSGGLLLRARRLGWTVAEVPVRWEHKEDSRVSALRDSVGTLYDLVRLRFIVRR